MNKVQLFILFIILWSCNQSTNQVSFLKKHTKVIKYARLFSIENYKDFKILHIYKGYSESATFSYVLSSSLKKVPDSLNTLQFIQIPVDKWVVTSTTHLPVLSMLHAENSLIGFPGIDYISSSIFRRKINNNEIKEIGFNGQINTEELLALKPKLLMLYNSGNDIKNNEIYLNNGIPIIYNADWLEINPLGRAEWIKVFGLLLDKEQQADSLFQKIERNYLKIKEKIIHDSLPLVFQGGKFGDKWFVPGGNSYAVQLIKDAGGEYLWKEDQHTGSIQLNYENILLKLPKAEIWLNPGMYENKNQLLEDIPVANNFSVVKNNKIYTYNLKKGPTGGILYFEYSNIHPDWILEDLFHIFHPQPDDYKFHFYQSLP